MKFFGGSNLPGRSEYSQLVRFFNCELIPLFALAGKMQLRIMFQRFVLLIAFRNLNMQAAQFFSIALFVLPFTVSAQNEEAFRLNQIQIIASHNSYKKKPDERVLQFLQKKQERLGRDLNPASIDYAPPGLSQGTVIKTKLFLKNVFTFALTERGRWAIRCTDVHLV
jgi:hypothetical protein